MDAAARQHCDKFVAAEIDAEALGRGDKALACAGKISQHRAVARRDLAEIFSADDTTGAAHVLHDDARVAGDVPSDMTRQHARFQIGRTAGVVVDKNGKLLAGVERLLSRGMSAAKRQGGNGQATACQHESSRIRLLLLAAADASNNDCGRQSRSPSIQTNRSTPATSGRCADCRNSSPGCGRPRWAEPEDAGPAMSRAFLDPTAAHRYI